MWDEPLVLGIRTVRSRLIVSADGYPSAEIMRRAHEASGAELVTLAVRGLDAAGSGRPLLESLGRDRVTIVATTSGCRTADEAVRTAYLAREAGVGELVSVDVVGDSRTEMPDLPAILEATKVLTADGFAVLAVAGTDPVAARRLEDAGATAVLVAAAPAGSGLGVSNPYALRLALESVTVPLIVAGGIGTASDAARAMELGCAGVLVGHAITGARDPEVMAEAMRLGVEAGRGAYKAGRVSRRLYRDAFGSPD
ncbi:MAG TPA: HisA/HisF-related TIM barrel protein [Methylomirabilota bacterium]|jgi:thiazole synthase|nr:HisA/HisF-related TIM barrel protein [Methylomirabilota bacterium]